ncbi:MAG TPA: NADP-dependent oxidoreductase [Rhizomicrobium sp.]|jgi:NADPH:quinone reductase-like Zn-dependent oxidoreductase|nr:NADP-dependent oxidoreductase [Rhizomicrobium sp.]
MNMHAIRIHKFGGPEVLEDEVLPVPEPKGDEILVRIEAASVNPVDYKTREGKFPKAPDDALPITLGRDLSGVVEATGSGAKDVSKDKAVFALLGYDRGAYAQHVVLKRGEWAAKPQNISHIEAAAVPLAALTAWQGMIDHGGLKSGQRVLIHGGAGGVGHFAIQIAKAKGAWVATTCAKRDFDFVRSLGADGAIDYKTEKFEDRVSDIDLVYDLIAGDTQERSFNVLKQGGTLVSTLQEPDKAKALYKDIKTAHYMAKPDADELKQIAMLIEAGKIHPVVHATYRLADAARAEQALATEHVRGKIVLTVEQ